MNGDARVEGGAHERAHLLVGLVLDAHQAEHHVRMPATSMPGRLKVFMCLALQHCAESGATSSAVSSSSGAWAESVIEAGLEAPGIGMTMGAKCELPREGDPLRGDAVSIGDLLEGRWLLAPTAPAREMPPSGLHGRKAMPSSAHTSSSG